MFYYFINLREHESSLKILSFSNNLNVIFIFLQVSEVYNRNRALEGDLVAVSLNDQSEWRVLNENVIEMVRKLNGDKPNYKALFKRNYSQVVLAVLNYLYNYRRTLLSAVFPRIPFFTNVKLV